MMFDENGRRISPVDIQKSKQTYPRSSLNDQSSERCRGVCKNYKGKRIIFKSRYAAGQTLCQVCDIYLNQDGISYRRDSTYCKCCNSKVRRNPRNLETSQQENQSTEDFVSPKSGKSYYELKDYIESEIKPQANYQFVMLKHILTRVSHKGKIAEDLAFYNNKDPSNINEVKNFLHVPVFDVLEKSGIVIKIFDSSIDDTPRSGSRNIIKYELDVFLEEYQLIDLDAKLQIKIDEWNDAHEIITFDKKYEFPDIDWNEHKQLLTEKISREDTIYHSTQDIAKTEQTVNYWLWSVTEEHWQQIKDENIWGSKVTAEQIQSRINTGDFIIFYIIGTKLIRGIFEIISDWEDDSNNLTWIAEKNTKEIIYKSKVNLKRIVLGTVSVDELDNLSIFVGKTLNAKNKTLMATGPGYPANNNKPVPKTDFDFIKKQLAESSATVELQKLQEEKMDSKLILKECPRCGLLIEGPLSEKELTQKIEESFGFRQMDPEDTLHKKPQSYCRRCRTDDRTFVKKEVEQKQMNVFDLEKDGISIKHYEMQSSEFILKGQNLTNDELVSKFGVGNMGGIRYSAKNNLILLCDTESGHYKDDIDKEFQIIYYTGEGQTGDQTLTGGNKRIADSEKTPLFYFLEVPQESGQNKRGALGKIYRFVGKVRYLKHATKTENDINGNPHKVIKFLLEIEK